MKRSDMISILQNSFIKHMNCEEACCPNDDVFYSTILRDLEQAGMSPPEMAFIEKIDPYEICDYTGYPIAGKIVGRRNWEEDLQKEFDSQ